MEFRPRDGPLMGKGAVESDAALATLLNAADDVLGRIAGGRVTIE